MTINKSDVFKLSSLCTWRSFLDDINLRSKVLLNILIGGRLQLRHIKQILSQIVERKHCSYAGCRYPFDTRDCSRTQRLIN